MAALITSTGFVAGCETVTETIDNVTGYVEDVTGRRTEPKFEPNAGPKLAPAELPRYKAGQSFAFDDGREEVVRKVQGETLVWRLNRSTTAVAYRNFVIPRLSWESRSRKGRSEVTAAPRMLWPLRVGNDQRFEVSQVIETKGGPKLQGGKARTEFKESWRCAVERTERVKVPAGVFDTFRIACFRYRPETTEWRQTRIFHYAPQIGHFVSREDIYASRPGKRIQLIETGTRSTDAPRAR